MVPATPDNPAAGANIHGSGASQSRMRNVATPSKRESPIAKDQAAAENADLDTEWVSRLMQTEGPGILRVLWRLLGREQDVMDAYQDCFCKLATRRGGRAIDSAKAYAYRTATNIAIEMIRSRQRRGAHWPAIVADRHSSESGAIDSQESGTAPDRLDDLREAISRLPDHLRNVVVLRDLSRMSYADVGRTLGIEPSTARVYRRHAVVKLAELLDGTTDHEP